MKITVGGSFFCCAFWALDAAGTSLEGLEVGSDISELAPFALAASATEAEARALALLARAEQGRVLLGQKLRAKGLSAPAIALALDRLEGRGLLSDQRFAEAWLRSRSLSQAGGPAKLVSALRGKGISDEVAREALARVFGAEERRELLAAAWKKALAKCKGDAGLARSALRAQGFKSQELRAFFEGEE